MIGKSSTFLLIKDKSLYVGEDHRSQQIPEQRFPDRHEDVAGSPHTTTRSHAGVGDILRGDKKKQLDLSNQNTNQLHLTKGKHLP